MMLAQCMKSVHDVPADTLVREDRILLKDLRVLEITDVQVDDDGITLQHYQLAAQERGTLTVPRNQRVKLLCGGRCYITRELDSLL